MGLIKVECGVEGLGFRGLGLTPLVYEKKGLECSSTSSQEARTRSLRAIKTWKEQPTKKTKSHVV